MVKLLIIAALPTVLSIPNKTCNRIQIGEQWYERDVLWSHIGRPYNLNIHKGSNILFFSYSDVDFQLGYINIDTLESSVIAGIKGGCAIAIDQDNDVVFLGGSDGIYKYNMMTRIADLYKEEGKNIWSLFYRKNLFYISYPSQKLHIEIDGSFLSVKEFEDFEVDNFFATGNNDIFYSNKTAFYKINNISLQSEMVNELISVRQITEDNEENMYLTTNTGIYIMSDMFPMRLILDMRNIYGLAFDTRNRFVISDENSIILLKPSTTGCKVDVDLHW